MSFQPGTRRVLTSCGWVVGETIAVHNYGHLITGMISDGGAWEVRHNRKLVSSGVESDPAYAAMEANEVAWKQRETLLQETKPYGAQ